MSAVDRVRGALARLASEPDPEGLARDRSGRAVARASYLLLLASAGGLAAVQRGEFWLIAGVLVACGASALDRRRGRRPSGTAVALAAGGVLALLGARELRGLAAQAAPLGDLLGVLAESFWVAGAAWAFHDKRWPQLGALGLCAALVALLALLIAESAAILLALLAIAWSLVLLLQRALRWRTSALLGSEDASVAGLDHGARRGASATIAQGLLASWLVCSASALAIAAYLVLPTRGARQSERADRDPERAEWGRLAGFAEGTPLGSFGELKQNFEPAFLVRPAEDDGGALLRALREGPNFWRGIAHASYDHAALRWVSEVPLEAPLATSSAASATRAALAQWRPGEAAIAYEQELLLTESRVLFALEASHSVELALRHPRARSLEGQLRRDREGVLWCVDEEGRGAVREGTQLVAYAARGPRGRERRSALPAAPPDARYAALPESLRRAPDFQRAAERFRSALAAAAGARAPSVSAVEKAIRDTLHARCRYSLNLFGGARAPADPLLVFLEGPEELRQAHCLFFATAAALLLRAEGYATRFVTGFAGGVERDGRWIVAAAHAHAWIELWCGRSGWIVLDPTPAAHQPPSEAQERAVRRARERLEAVAMEREFAAARERGEEPFFAAARRFVQDFSSPDSDVRERAEDELRYAASAWGRSLVEGALRAWPATIGLALLLLFAPALWRAQRRKGARAPWRRGRGAPRAAGVRLYDRCLLMLARAGHHRGAHETPRELAARIGPELGAELGDKLRALTRFFERTRYGGREPSGREQREAEEELRALERLLRSSRSGARR